MLLQKGTDQEKIKKYVLERWPDLYAYHENPLNPAGWNDCFLQRKLEIRIKKILYHVL